MVCDGKRRMFKRIDRVVLMIGAWVLLAGCGMAQKGGTDGAIHPEGPGLIYEDALGNSIEFTVQEMRDIAERNTKVAVLGGSYAEIWSLAGGEPDVVTDDACDEGRAIAVSATAVSAGSLKNPNLEILLASDVGTAMLSADIEGQLAIRTQLEDMGIKTVYHSVETFEDYLKVLEFFTELTGRRDCYEEYGASVAQTVAEQTARQDDSHPTILFLRAYGSGIRAKGSDSMTGAMLKELGCINIADREERLINDLSMEVILETDPDYIFLTVMGDEEVGLETAKSLLTGNQAWNDLTAIQEDRYYILPQNLFHNKPNHRWGESYRILADILYPEQGAS